MGFWSPMSEWLSPQFHWYAAVLGVAVVWLCLLMFASKNNRKGVHMFFGVLAQTACIIFFFGKLGCFADGHGGCIGEPTELPWGVTYSWGRGFGVMLFKDDITKENLLKYYVRTEDQCTLHQRHTRA